MQLKLNHKTCTVILTSLFALTGCATTELLEGGSSSPRTVTTSQKVVLTQDEVVAFGKPATALPNMPSTSLVIVGEKNSYVLSQGGYEVGQLLTNLDPRYIQVTKALDFHSPNNDGRFQGSLDIAYAKLKSSFTQSDYDFMLRNKGQECSTASDLRMNAQRFCFSVPVQGGVYPAVSNLALIQSQSAFKALSHPYQVSIYTNQSTTTTTQSNGGGANAVGKLVMLPFALAFDVVTLPVQVLAGLN
ncbi:MULTISPECIES: hypothetical protein [unclassified Moraxella]|uniref:hypothetical protein n=1 Tax=unclassified Moraxella TaxID=2685852 RepID=UPI003AF5F3F4